MTCPFIFMLTRKIEKRGLILIGYLLVAFALLMIGGSAIIPAFYNNPEVPFMGLIIIGLAGSMISIPILPEMLDAVEEDKELALKYDRENLENLISGLFVSFQSIGEAIGPMLNSVLVEKIGFRRAYEVYSFYILLFCLVYFMTCGDLAFFGAPSCAACINPGKEDEEQSKLIQRELVTRQNGHKTPLEAKS